MYKKVGKTFNSPYGIIDKAIKDFNRPFIFFAVPLGNKKDINGYLSSLVYLLRLRKGKEINIGLDVSDVPFDLYASSSADIDSFVDALNKIEGKDISVYKRLFRNINFVSFCNGSHDLLSIIKALHNQLLEKRFNEVEIKKIMSQISVLQVVDNLNINGKRIPYVTTNTVHIKQDVENRKWFKEDTKSEEGSFSKVFVKNVAKNKRVIVEESFGEGALQFGCDHDYTFHYLLFPVMNSLMSICLVNSVYSSLKGEEIDLDYYSKGIDFVLDKAREYELSKGKKLDDYTTRELEEFSNYMINIMTEYVKEKFAINKINEDEIQRRIKEEESVREIATSLSDYYIRRVRDKISDILEYKDVSLDDLAEMKLGNAGRVKLPARVIISTMYKALISYVDEIIKEIDKVDFDSPKDEEIRFKLIEWKKNYIRNIYDMLNSEELIELLNKCDLEIQDKRRL